MYTTESLIKTFKKVGKEYGFKFVVSNSLDNVWGEYCSQTHEIRISSRILLLKNEKQAYELVKHTIFHEFSHFLLDKKGKFKRLHRGGYYRCSDRYAAARKAVLDEIRVEKYARYLQKKFTGTTTALLGYSGVDNSEFRDEATIEYYVLAIKRSWDEWDLVVRSNNHDQST